jgi:uncharacterized cofD-like protein
MWTGEGSAPDAVQELLERQYSLRVVRNAHVPQLKTQRPTRILCLGGGTGLPMVLRGLARRADGGEDTPGLALTAVVTMSDDGGSSGRLRRNMGMLPPGDIRNCLVALAEGKGPLAEVFQHRFSGGKGLSGHALGNLLITALAQLKGDFLEAVRLSGELLGSKGNVLPCTLDEVHLVAQKADGVEVVGERNLGRIPGRVHHVALSPARPRPVDGLIEAIRNADLITVGPGSLYSSVLPNLLVDGVAQAMRETRALKVMVSNLMTQPGETDGMSCSDHVQAIIDHAGPVLDAVLVNIRQIPPEAMARYAKKGSAPVTVDRRALLRLGVAPVEADLLKEGPRVRHAGNKVARCLLKMARSGL